MLKIISESAKPFLAGDEFSPGEIFEIGGNFFDGGRVELLEAMARGRAVLHIGCADHAGLIEEKHGRGQWLHGRLGAAASKLTGVDVNADALAVARRMGFEDLWICDVTQPWPDELGEGISYEIAILGEIVEHLDNPVAFLQSLRTQAKGRIQQLAVTVPNAWSIDNLRSVLKGNEHINTDHRYWFTPFTAAKVLHRAGWQVQELWFCEAGRSDSGVRRRGRAQLLRRKPQLAETIVAIAEPIR